MEGMGPPPLPKAKKKRRWPKILLWVVAVPLIVIAGFVSLFMVLDLFTKDLPVRDEDRALFVTAADLMPYYDWLDPDAGIESMTKQRLFDGTHELYYEFSQDDPEDPDSCLAWMSCSIATYDTEGDADIGYTATNTGSKLGLGLAGFEFKKAEGLFRWGRRTRCAWLMWEGEIAGLYVLCVGEKVTYEWVLSGLYLDDPETVAEILRPVLSRLTAWRP